MHAGSKRAAKTPRRAELYRRLPAVDEVLRFPQLAALLSSEGQTAVADAVRAVLARLRQEISARRLDESGLDAALSAIAGTVQRQLGEELRYSLRPVINATGVILHTNLGRAPLAARALEHVAETAGAYSNLEFDLAAAERAKRDVHVDRLFRKILHDSGHRSGAVSTIVVNNNAAGLLVALNTLAEGSEVLVSRGELVEIGESFRIPDIMSKSGAMLREVAKPGGFHVDISRSCSGSAILRAARQNSRQKWQYPGYGLPAHRHHVTLVGPETRRP